MLFEESSKRSAVKIGNKYLYQSLKVIIEEYVYFISFHLI